MANWICTSVLCELGLFSTGWLCLCEVTLSFVGITYHDSKKRCNKGKSHFVQTNLPSRKPALAHRALSQTWTVSQSLLNCHSNIKCFLSFRKMFSNCPLHSLGTRQLVMIRIKIMFNQFLHNIHQPQELIKLLFLQFSFPQLFRFNWSSEGSRPKQSIFRGRGPVVVRF
jgi:hypothetical protein